MSVRPQVVTPVNNGPIVAAESEVKVVYSSSSKAKILTHYELILTSQSITYQLLGHW